MIRIILLLLSIAGVLRAQPASILTVSEIEPSWAECEGSPTAAVMMPDGGYFVCFITGKAVDDDDWTIGVMRIDPNGSVDWSTALDLENARIASGEPFSRGLVAESVIRTDVGNYLVAAVEHGRWTEKEGVTFLTFSPHGDLLAIRSHASSVNGAVLSFRSLASGTIAIVNGDGGSQLVWFDDDGDILFQRSYRARGQDWMITLRDVEVDGDGNLVLVGDTYYGMSTNEGRIQGVLLRLDLNGNVISSHWLSVEETIQPLNVDTLADQRLIIVGTTVENDSVTHPFHLILSSTLAVDGGAQYRKAGNAYSIKRLGDGTLLLLLSGKLDRGRERLIDGDGYVHMNVDGSMLVARRMGTLPGASGIDDNLDRQEQHVENAASPRPAGFVSSAGFAAGPGDGGLLYGADEHCLPVYSFFSPTVKHPCYKQKDDPIDTLLLHIDFTVSDIEMISPHDRDFDRPIIMDVPLRNQRVVLSPICPDGFFPRPTSVRPDNESDLAIEPTRNVIRRGEQIELDVHIERSSETTFAITLAHAGSGEISAEQRSSFAAPFHEPVYVPTTGLAPGLYMVVLKVGDREVGAKVQIVP